MIWMLIPDFCFLFHYSACLARLHLLIFQGENECKGCVCVQKFKCQILFTLLKNQLPSSIRWRTASLSRPELNLVIKHFPTFPNGSPACFQGHRSNCHLWLRVCVCRHKSEAVICVHTHLLRCMYVHEIWRWSCYIIQWFTLNVYESLHMNRNAFVCVRAWMEINMVMSKIALILLY